MDLIKTGIGLTKTIRNVGRLKEIVLIFAKHGFDEFISLGITSAIPNFVLPKSKRSLREELKQKSRKDWGQVIGSRLRQCFEELGPTFIKFGQLLSTREDIFDESFIDEMKLLRDKVKGVPFDVVKSSVEKSLGKKIEDVFESVDEKPLGTASISVVHRATLKTGEKVVLKVRRPNIDREIETDYSLLMFISTQTEKISEEIRYLGISRIIKDFAGGLQNELNFNIEALNSRRLKKNLSQHDSSNLIHVPKVYDEFSCEDLMVMELIEGTPFSDSKEIEKKLDDLLPKIENIVSLFLRTFLQDGFFHADLHGGNFFFMNDGKIGLVDYGLMGTLGKKSRKNFVAIIYALMTYNYENLVYEFLDVAEYDSIPDVDQLINDIRDALSPFVGLTVQQTNFTVVLKAIVSTLKTHRLYLPREWFIVFRALITLDGVGKSLGMDLDIFSLLEGDIQEIVQANFSKEDLIEDAVWAGRDILSSSRAIPRHLKWFVKEWSKRGYAFEINHKGHEEAFKLVSSSVIFLAFTLLTCVFFISGVYFYSTVNVVDLQSIPTITWILWAMASGAFLLGYNALIRK